MPHVDALLPASEPLQCCHRLLLLLPPLSAGLCCRAQKHEITSLRQALAETQDVMLKGKQTYNDVVHTKDLQIAQVRRRQQQQDRRCGLAGVCVGIPWVKGLRQQQQQQGWGVAGVWLAEVCGRIAWQSSTASSRSVGRLGCGLAGVCAVVALARKLQKQLHQEYHRPGGVCAISSSQTRS